MIRCLTCFLCFWHIVVSWSWRRLNLHTEANLHREGLRACFALPYFFRVFSPSDPRGAPKTHYGSFEKLNFLWLPQGGILGGKYGEVVKLNLEGSCFLRGTEREL